MNCPDCGAVAELKDSSIIYKKSFGPAWVCPNYPACECFVGCHPGTENPLGTLANAQTRIWRKAAHGAFDRIWKGGRLKRGHAYARLAAHLGLPVIHIGESDAARCEIIFKWAKAQLGEDSNPAF